MMVRLRHIAPFIAVLLSVIILAETTELVGCHDEAVGTPQAEAPAAIALDAAPLLVDYAGIDLNRRNTSDKSAQESRVVPDCLCHITFVSTAMLPYLGAPVELPVVYPFSEASTSGGEVLVPSPVPLS